MRPKIITGIVVIVAGAYLTNYYVTPWVIGSHELETAFRPKSAERFRASLWASTTNRYKMGCWLAESESLTGLSEEAVVKLLGQPDYRQATVNGTNLSYRLASQETYPARSFLFPDRFWNADAWHLEVVLASNRVQRSEINH